MNGASTNPDAHVVAYAAAQLKKGLDCAKKLGAENYGKVTNVKFLITIKTSISFVIKGNYCGDLNCHMETYFCKLNLKKEKLNM